MKHPCVIGASGLIGGLIVEALLQQTSLPITLLVRRPLSMNHARIKEIVVDFTNEASIAQAMTGCDTVFVAIGTTQQKVKGDVDAYRKIDYAIPTAVAAACVVNNVSQLLIVSSVGADSKSGNFYLRLKGEVEDVIAAKPIPTIAIMQPSLLLGKRKEFRLGERISQWIMPAISFLLPQKYRPIAADTVANAMVQMAIQNKEGLHRYTWRDMQPYAIQ